MKEMVKTLRSNNEALKTQLTDRDVHLSDIHARFDQLTTRSAYLEKDRDQFETALKACHSISKHTDSSSNSTIVKLKMFCFWLGMLLFSLFVCVACLSYGYTRASNNLEMSRREVSEIRLVQSNCNNDGLSILTADYASLEDKHASLVIKSAKLEVENSLLLKNNTKLENDAFMLRGNIAEFVVFNHTLQAEITMLNKAKSSLQGQYDALVANRESVCNVLDEVQRSSEALFRFETDPSSSALVEMTKAMLQIGSKLVELDRDSIKILDVMGQKDRECNERVALCDTSESTCQKRGADLLAQMDKFQRENSVLLGRISDLIAEKAILQTRGCVEKGGQLEVSQQMKAWIINEVSRLRAESEQPSPVEEAAVTESVPPPPNQSSSLWVLLYLGVVSAALGLVWYCSRLSFVRKGFSRAGSALRSGTDSLKSGARSLRSGGDSVVRVCRRVIKAVVTEEIIEIPVSASGCAAVSSPAPGPELVLEETYQRSLKFRSGDFIQRF